MTEDVTLNQKEQKRLIVLNRVLWEQMTGAEAAEVLGLSVRQLRRILAAYREDGAAALAHGNRGRAPAHTLGQDVRQRVRELARSTYVGINHQHLTELLAEREGIVLSASTVKRILAEVGLQSPRTRRAPQHRRRRERYPQEGMLLQMDGSSHDWLQGRGPKLALVAGIDDATGQVPGATFREQEDAAGYLVVLEQVVHSKGRPLAIYHDRHTIFGASVVLSIEQELVGMRREPSQVERVLAELGISSIPARSPQAKGRIERLFGTFQDRLVTELRLAGISTHDAANAFLPGFLDRFNRQFAVPAQQEGSAYRPLGVELDPQTIFCFKYLRTVGADNTVRFGGQRLQIQPCHGRASYAKCRVEVAERLDGSLAISYQGHCLLTRSAPLEAPILRTRSGEPRPTEVQPPVAAVAAGSGGMWAADQQLPPAEPDPGRPHVPTPRKPAPDHPWRRPFKPSKDRITERLG